MKTLTNNGQNTFYMTLGSDAKNPLYSILLIPNGKTSVKDDVFEEIVEFFADRGQSLESYFIAVSG